MMISFSKFVFLRNEDNEQLDFFWSEKMEWGFQSGNVAKDGPAWRKACWIRFEPHLIEFHDTFSIWLASRWWRDGAIRFCDAQFGIELRNRPESVGIGAIFYQKWWNEPSQGGG